MKITVGAIPYFWPRARVEEFYAVLAQLPVDCVYVGETVCSKRRELSPAAWLSLARELTQQVSQVVVSTLALIEAGSELAVLKRLVDNGEFMVEANDLAGMQLAIDSRLPFVAGPTVNIYNGHTLALLAARGLRRWVPPVEISALDVRCILDEFSALAIATPIETEIFAYGRLPLAHSARCFSARHHGRGKDTCGFVCLEHPQGLRVATREGEDFLRINGVQVQSDAINGITDLAHLRAHGADLLRLSPAGDDFLDVVRAYIALRAGDDVVPGIAATVNGYWYGEPGMAAVTPGG